MTVAIGLVCSDGVLVAADSMSSSGPTARTSKKVHTFPTLPAIWTAAGSVYVIEEVESELARLDRMANDDATVMAQFTTPKLESLRSNIGRAIQDTMKRCYEAALPFGLNTRTPTGQHPFLSDFLVLGYANAGPYFLEVAQDGQMNWHHRSAFYAVGSGGPFATVAHALMGHYLELGPLSVELGKRLAYRTIETTCAVSSAGVATPVQIAVADGSGARILDEAEIQELKDVVAGWKQLERETLDRDPGTPAVPGEGIPDLPSLSDGEATGRPSA